MKYLIVLMFSMFLFGQNIYEPKYGIIENDTLTASSSTDTSMEVYVGTWQGAVTLAVSPTLLSGTAVDVTITGGPRFKGFNYGTAEDVATISADDITNGVDQYIVLSDLSWWTWTDYVRFYFSSASGTYSIRLEYQVKGQ